VMNEDHLTKWAVFSCYCS